MSLPEPYLSWWRAVLGADPPHEPHATCEACPMCAEAGWRPSVKCCTYAPSLPNFRAGAALRAGGRPAEIVRRRLTEARVTDTWLHPSAEEEASYDAERARFGATDGVVCPYLVPGEGCGVYAQRNAVCATWFCRHGKGEVGAALWDAAAELFHFAEGGVAVACGGDGYEIAAERAERLSWEDVRLLGGRELAAREQRLREAWAAWVHRA